MANSRDDIMDVETETKDDDEDNEEDNDEGNEEGNDEGPPPSSAISLLPNKERAEEGVRKNKGEFWGFLKLSAEPERNRERSHRRGRPRKERPERKDLVQRGRVTKRGGVSSRRVQLSKKPAPAKRKPRPPPKPVRKITSASSMSSSDSSCCSYCARHERRTEQTQARSDSKLFSPLLVKAYAELVSEPPVEPEPFSEVTPDMIVEALRHLTMWRQYVPDLVILDYIKRNYPVNPDFGALLSELSTKLTIAATVGFIEKCSVKTTDHWCLKSGLIKRKLTRDHVDLFWKLYVDTLESGIRKIPPKTNPNVIDGETNTGVEQNEAGRGDEDDKII